MPDRTIYALPPVNAIYGTTNQSLLQAGTAGDYAKNG